MSNGPAAFLLNFMCRFYNFNEIWADLRIPLWQNALELFFFVFMCKFVYFDQILRDLRIPLWVKTLNGDILLSVIHLSC